MAKFAARKMPTTRVRRRALTLTEIVADGIIHGVGLLVALVAGTALITLTAVHYGADAIVSLSIYMATLLAVLTASLAYNIAPEGRLKAWFARLDQAAIFLFIAGSYTPLLAAAGGSTRVDAPLAIVWVLAAIGMALKLWVPHRFGRIAIVLYLAIGWSGLAAVDTLAQALPADVLWLIFAGGIAFTAGVVFHLWEELRFQTVVWHGFVVLGTVLHLIAIYRAVLTGHLARRWPDRATLDIMPPVPW